MQSIGKYHDKQVYWLDYDNFTNPLPDKGWACFAIANHKPDTDKFGKFVKPSIFKNILGFKGYGTFGKELHELFAEIIKSYNNIDVMASWQNDETLADAFWQYLNQDNFHKMTDADIIKIICTDLDGVNRSEELKSYIKEFELGWIPSVNTKHEVWQRQDGLTTLCFADERGNDCRKLLEPGSNLIHTFYAASYFESMTIYYKYMDWGTYTTRFEVDKLPYSYKNNQ